MIFFPFTRPQAGVYVTADRLCVAHVHRRLGHQSYGGYVEQPLPSGTIRLSPVEENILEKEEVSKLLQDAMGRSKKPQSVALCLPDLCARTTILEMATLPKKRKERHALVQWRLQQELKLSKEKTRISYQILPSPGLGLTGLLGTDQPIHLLATAIKEHIIEAYETVCLNAGLVPISIHLASLAIFNMCRSVMDSTLKAPQMLPSLPQTQFFVYLSDWGISLIALRNQIPNFLRVKPLRQLSQWTNTEQAGHQGTHAGDQGETKSRSRENLESHSIQPLEETNHLIHSAKMITNELLGTLQYYFETHENTLSSETVHPLFLIGSQDPERILRHIAEFIQEEFPVDANQGKPRIQVIPVFPGNPTLNVKALPALPQWTGATLPAFAASGQTL